MNQAYQELWGRIGLPAGGSRVWIRWYLENLKRVKFTIGDLPQYDKVLAVAAGPAGRDSDRLAWAILRFQPDFIVYCRDYWRLQGDLIRRSSTPYLVFDSEIEPQSWWLLMDRGGKPPDMVALHVRRAWMPGFCEGSKIFWFWAENEDLGNVENAEETWKARGAVLKHKTSGEAALELASRLCRRRLGVIGYQANEDGYRHLSGRQMAILAASRLQVVDFSGSGSVNKWCKAGNGYVEEYL